MWKDIFFKKKFYGYSQLQIFHDSAHEEDISWVGSA